MPEDDNETCGEYFTVVIWRDPNRPYRTNSAACECTLNKSHLKQGHPHHDQNKGYIEGRDYS